MTKKATKIQRFLREQKRSPKSGLRGQGEGTVKAVPQDMEFHVRQRPKRLRPGWYLEKFPASSVNIYGIKDYE